ncbi:hypothetical protein K438DRAFT_1829691 [Mycena galopus ATCC 62051]|nr:hypothetical protein K438DRAFT_1829691 [Mycena galopus ATCC 62051]
MVLFIAAAVLPLLAILVGASPYKEASLRRSNVSDPDFPSSPASCGQCAQNYSSIELCMTVVSSVVNFSTIIDNPGSFTDILTCGCSPTFNVTFPECLDCFESTNQTALFGIDDPADTLTGLTKVCDFERSVGIGNGALVNSMPLFSLVLGAVVLMLGNA